MKYKPWAAWSGSYYAPSGVNQRILERIAAQQKIPSDRHINVRVSRQCFARAQTLGMESGKSASAILKALIAIGFEETHDGQNIDVP